MIAYLIEVLKFIWDWNATQIPHNGNVKEAIPPLIVAGAVMAGSAIYKGISGNNQRKRALAAQKKLDYQNQVRNGASILNASEQYAIPEYDDDPFTTNERTLYPWGASNASGGESGGQGGGQADMYMSILSSAIEAGNQYMDNRMAKKELAYTLKKPVINTDTSRFANDAQKDKLYADKQMLNDPYAYAFGGGIVNKQSSNTAMVKAGSHESGEDMMFYRPDGSQAKIEGGEGMRSTPNGVNIYSDRINVPGSEASIADVFSNLSSLKGNLEEDGRKTNNAITKNTIGRKIAGIDFSMDNLMQMQEGIKKLNGAGGDTQQYALGGDGYLVDNDGKYVLDANGNKIEAYDMEKAKSADVFGRIDTKGLIDKKSNPYAVSTDTTLQKTPESGKVKNHTFWNTLKSDDGVNGIATGLTLLDNIYNANIMDDVKGARARYIGDVELDKEYDTTAAEYGVKKEIDNFYKNVDKNTTSSVVGLNMKLAAMTSGIDKLNQIYDTKEKYETEMKNKEVLANSQIEAQNAEIYNRNELYNTSLLNDKVQAKSANFSNAIDDVVNGILRYQGHRTQKEEFMAKESKYADKGVIIDNLRSGRYASAPKADVEAMIQEGINAGTLSYEDAIAGIDAHNKKAQKSAVVSKGNIKPRK